MQSRLVLLFVAACGTSSHSDDTAVDGHPTGDGPATDASIGIDATTGQLSVTTHLRGSSISNAGYAASGIEIVVSSADGNVTGDTATTDALGHATLTAAVGDSVTAIYRATKTTLVTIAGVAPDDQLTFGTAYDTIDNAASVAMNATWPALSIPGVADYEVLAGSCGWWHTTQAPATGEQAVICPADRGPVTFVYGARDNRGDLVAWGRTDQVAVVDNGDTSLTQWLPLADFTMSASGAPADAVASLEAKAVVGDISAFNIGAGSLSPGPLAPQTQPFVDHPDSFAITARYDRGSSTQSFDYTLAGDATSFDDAAPALLPWVTSVTADPSTQDVSWSTEGNGTSAYDTIMIDLRWARTNGSSFEWILIEPPGVTHLHLPDLHFGDDGLHPETFDTVTVSAYLSDHGWGDYDSVRSHTEQEIRDDSSRRSYDLP